MRSARLDKIDFDVVPPTARVCNMFGHEVPMAEYCISAMLNSCIDWAGMRDSFRGRSWGQAYSSRVRRPELAGKTIGIVGFGHIGQEVAKRARGFDTRILAVASRAKPAPEGVEWIKGPEGVEALAAQSDFIDAFGAADRRRRGIIGAREIAAMKPDRYLINVGRGGLADEQALFDTLRDERIRGAALDAWYAYPASADDAVKASTLPFADLPNVVATPHEFGLDGRACRAPASDLADNLRRFIAGEPMQNVVRPPLAAAAGN